MGGVQVCRKLNMSVKYERLNLSIKMTPNSFFTNKTSNLIYYFDSSKQEDFMF